MDPSEEEYLRETIKGLAIMMSDKWLTEGELSLKPIHINSPSSSIRCRIKNQDVDVLHNPTVRANLISDEIVLAFLGDKVLVSTDRKLKRSAGAWKYRCSTLSGSIQGIVFSTGNGGVTIF